MLVDPALWEEPEAVKTISCLFCQGVITFFNGSPSKYFSHLQTVHDIHFNHRLALVINMMDKEKTDGLIEQFLSENEKDEETKPVKEATELMLKEEMVEEAQGSYDETAEDGLGSGVETTKHDLGKASNKELVENAEFVHNSTEDLGHIEEIGIRKTDNKLSRIRYTKEYKKSAIERLEQNDNNISKTAKQLGIKRTNLQGWHKNRDWLDNGRRKSRKIRGFHSEMELKLAEWFRDEVSKGQSITTDQIKDKAKMILRDTKPNEDFKASSGWLWRFLNRFNFSI